jgi:PilZ domain-containing protein
VIRMLHCFFLLPVAGRVGRPISVRHTDPRFAAKKQFKTGIRMERRLHTRHRARTTVYVQIPGRRGKLCRARNLSANGVFVETENLGLQKGSVVELAFAINLGAITKIHRRTAIVAHVSRGGTGLRMESYVGR